MEIHLTEPQSEMFLGPEKYKLFLGGFGSGKTETLICSVLRDLMESNGATVALYAPTYDLIKLNLLPRLEECLKSMGLKYKINGSDLVIRIQGLGSIICRSLSNPERIISYEVYRSHIDELDTLPTAKAEMVWNKVIARNRLNGYGENRVSAYTTPEGFRFCYNRWERNKTAGYKIYRAPTYSNPHLPADYVDNLRSTYPAGLIEAYIEGRFVNLTSGTVYNNYDRRLNDSGREIIFKDTAEKQADRVLYIGMDFNVMHMSGVVHVKDEQGPIAVDEIVDVYDTPEMIQVIKSRYPHAKIRVYPDSSGGNRKSVNASSNDISLLQDAGFAVIADPSNPRVRDRVLAMNVLFCNNEGVRRYRVNTSKCPTYADNLEQQVWTAQGEPDKSSGNDHTNDAGGYFVCQDYRIIKPVHSLNIQFPR